MRPKKTVIVVTDRPELRFALAVAGRLNVIDASTWVDFEEHIRASRGLIDLAIIDTRDSPEIADQALTILHRVRPGMLAIVISDPNPRPDLAYHFDQIVPDGSMFLNRLLDAIALRLARKAGPQKGSHHKIYAGLA